MKRIIPFSLIVFLASGVFAQVGTLTVTVLSSEVGTGLTEIEYTFTGDAGTYDISAEVSFDNGGSYFPIPDEDLTGQRTGVIPGTYSLTWNGSANFPETFSDETIVKITADFTWQCDDDITFTYRGSEVTYGTILVDYGGTVGEKCWLDRNLGAYPMPFVPVVNATGNTDTRLYGDLFQWGRAEEGHQLRGNTDHHSGQATTPEPNTGATWDGKFITGSSDWLASQTNDLWQGEEGINNPCPPGWRVPTEEELNAERLDWSSDNAEGAYASNLRWPVGGNRGTTGTPGDADSSGYVWSSTFSGDYAKLLTFGFDFTGIGSYSRAYGMSVRCVRN